MTKNLKKTPTVNKNQTKPASNENKKIDASQAYLQQGSMNTVLSHAVSGRVWEPPQQSQQRVWNLTGHDEGNEGPARQLPAPIHGAVPTPAKRTGTCYLPSSSNPLGCLKQTKGSCNEN